MMGVDDHLAGSMSSVNARIADLYLVRQADFISLSWTTNSLSSLGLFSWRHNLEVRLKAGHLEV